LIATFPSSPDQPEFFVQYQGESFCRPPLQADGPTPFYSEALAVKWLLECFKGWVMADESFLFAAVRALLHRIQVLFTFG
jgi:hypothetical protein